MFSEFLDHTGLKPGGIYSFTRNLPHTGILRFLFHPHQDTYHLTHHFLPNIPHYHLKKADSLLRRDSQYLSAHHCDSYFFGKHSALNCWVGKCEFSEVGAEI